jgi:uncharacterized membrane protein YfcA
MMNAMAGGGSFVSLPALIAVGVPSVQANASSTVALFPGSVASTWAYRSGLCPIGGVSLRPMLVVTLVGGIAGAFLLLYTPTHVFDVILPWLLLVASSALAFGRPIRDWLRSRWRIGRTAVLAAQFVLGIYGGYFGGAVGIMMLAVWGLVDEHSIKELNPTRTLMVGAANGIAVVTFILAHAVQWPETLAMLVGGTVGGYAGAHVGKRLPAPVIRIGTLLVTAAITIAFFVKAYGR